MEGKELTRPDLMKGRQKSVMSSAKDTSTSDKLKAIISWLLSRKIVKKVSSAEYD